MRNIQSSKPKPASNSNEEMRTFLKGLNVKDLDWKEALLEIKSYLPVFLIKIEMSKNKYRLKFSDIEINLEMKDSHIPGFKRCPTPVEVRSFLTEHHPDRVEVYDDHLTRMENLTTTLDNHSAKP